MSLVNFKVKTSSSETFFLNEHGVGCLTFLWGVSCKHGVMWGVRKKFEHPTPCTFFLKSLKMNFLLWKGLGSNIYYCAFQLPYKLMQYNKMCVSLLINDMLFSISRIKTVEFYIKKYLCISK